VEEGKGRDQDNEQWRDTNENILETRNRRSQRRGKRKERWGKERKIDEERGIKRSRGGTNEEVYTK
jgi:hypothetical protein